MKGMGFERLVALLQGKKSNYDTDLFQPLFNAIQKCSNAPEYRGTFGDEDIKRIDYGYRILADHARMITVALADNMLPEQNPKLRRVLRNAIEVGESIFRKSNIVAELACNVADNLGIVYPELQSNLKQVQRIIEFEEDLYKRLRDSSGKMWNKMVKNRPELASITDWMAPGLLDGYKDLQSMLKELRKTDVLPGTVAFKLYDTYGLHLETIAELAQIESLHFDENDFKKQLDNRRYQSRIGLEKHNAVITKESLRMLEEYCVPKTDDSFKYNYTYDDTSYKFPVLNSKLIGIIINGELVASKNYSSNTKTNNTRATINIDEVSNNTNEIGIIMDKTVCYSLEGGQTSDKGDIYIKNLHFNIENIRKVNGYVIHSGYFTKPDLSISELYLQVDDECLIKIKSQIRTEIMKHHTAAHLLNAAVKRVMCVIHQRSCMINTDSLKLQFNSFGEQLTSKKMRIIEDYINGIIRSHAAVTVRMLNSLQLFKQNDITLVPGEIYPYTDIRIMEVDTNDLKVKEACCGTHVHNTGVLQHFCFLTYTSKGATNRTVKAVVGSRAVCMKQASEKIWSEITELEQNSENIEFTYEKLNAKINQIKQEINEQSMQLPYLFKEECLTCLNNLNKAKWLREKEIEKTLVTREIINAANFSPRFIVYYLNKNLTYLSLHEVVSIFPGIPILILSCTNGTVKARCSIPQEIASNTFNARSWMDIVLEIFNAEYGPIKGFKPMLVASMKSKQISHNYSQIQIKKAIAETTKFASMHVKKIESVNKKNQ